MLEPILPDEAVKTIEKERELLERVRSFAKRFEPDGEPALRVTELIDHLDDMFLLVVVGEVKAGKSAFINALLDADLCPEGPLPLTDRVHVLAHGDKPSEASVEPHVLRRTVPLDNLRRMNVVDTPGTNSPLKRHQEITESFLPRADIIFFVTSIDCPLTQTELEFLGEIRQRWRKEVACVLAKIDMRSEQDQQVVVDYLKRSFSEHLGFSPPIFPVSSKQAQAARRDGDAAALEASGMPAIERYTIENLSEVRRVQLKLRSPLGAVLDIIGGIDASAAARIHMLEGDFAGWNAIQEQISFAATSLKERAELHIAPIGVAFENLEARGRSFLRDVIRLRNLRLITDRGRFREAFNRDVVRGAANEIETQVEDAARWLGEETRALWERSLSHFNETVSLTNYRDEIAAGAGPTFRKTRRETLDRIVENARRTLVGWNIDGECQRVRDLASRSLARLIGVEVVAAGVGAAVAAALLPGVGVAIGAVIALGGFLILPARRQKAVEGFERGVRGTRDALMAALREAIGAESDRATAAVLDGFSPFHDFYQARRHTLEAIREEARGLIDETVGLQATLE